jgi:DNA-binding GntR family transcriptional regulator
MEHRSISIADQIFDQLERDILAGKYVRGEVLSELGLSKQLGVSRTPIREAIRRLEQEDFLEESGRGAVVVGIISVMGDLVESRSKRGVGVKDSGRIMPGHGGMLDRTDSMIFGSMVAYYILVIGGIL